MANPFTTIDAIQALADSAPTSTTLFNFDSGTKVPITAILADHYGGAPHVRKKYRRVLFHGTGTAWVRIFVDGAMVLEDEITMLDADTQPRAAQLPRGTNGYAIRVEITGICNVRSLSYVYDPMAGRLDT